MTLKEHPIKVWRDLWHFVLCVLCVVCLFVCLFVCLIASILVLLFLGLLLACDKFQLSLWELFGFESEVSKL